MAVEILMPRLGWTMEEGTLVEWIKKDGDPVQPGDVMFIVESDKALNEVECFESGIFRIPPGSDVVGKLLPVGTLLAITQPGEALPAGGQTAAPAESAAPAAQAAPIIETASAAPVSASSGELPAISPRARRVAAELGVDWTGLKGSGRTGRIVERDVRAAAAAAQLFRFRPSLAVQPVNWAWIWPHSRGADARPAHHPRTCQMAAAPAPAQQFGRPRCWRNPHTGSAPAPDHQRTHVGQRPHHRAGHPDDRSGRHRTGQAAAGAENCWTEGRTACPQL